MTPNRVRLLIEAILLLAVLLAQGRLTAWVLEWPWFRVSLRRRVAAWAMNGLIAVWLGGTLAGTTMRVAVLLPAGNWRQWNLAAATCWLMLVTGVLPLAVLMRRVPPFDPRRRKLLRAAQATALGAPLAVLGFGFLVTRKRFEQTDVQIGVAGLPRDLDGLRIVQISDIHLGPFLGPADLKRVVAMANETRAHVAVVTGDLITVQGDPIEDCLRLLTGLRAEAGTLACLGNHEAYADARERAARLGARLGIPFLRSQARRLRFGTATLNVAGIDYQPGSDPGVPGGRDLLAAGAANLLLSHNPNVFPAAARLGFDLVLAGHTHGGQITMEILDKAVTPVRFMTPYIQGLFRSGRGQLYVNRGIGTVGVPVRIGVPPEVTLIRLCAI